MSTASLGALSPDGTRISWRRDGAGPPIVLVHGATGDRGNWIACTPYLTARFSVYAVDRRGRGRSGDAPDYSLEREYHDLASVAEAVAAEHGQPVTVLGHSYGGVVALGAVGVTSAITRLALYEPPVLLSRYHDCERWAREIERLVATGRRDRAALAFFDRAASAEEIEAIRAVPAAWRQVERDVHTVARELRSLPAVAQRDYHEVRLPTLLLAGEHSDRPLRSSVEHLAELLPLAQRVDIPGQRHLAQTFAPKRFCAQVLQFAAP